MGDIIIRQAEPKDSNSIYEIELVCFPDPWSLESVKYELEENPYAFYVVAECDDKIVGYAGLWWILDEGHITNVAVKPEFRQRKIGDGIMSVLIDFTLKQGILHHTLEVRKSNEAAINMYKKHGFAVEGERKNYYKTGGNAPEDALIMWRHDE